MILRNYQQQSLDALYAWWMAHPGITETPILVAPTGSGKSVVIAELVRLLFDTWPDQHPRTLVIVPSKELAEQNADKLRQLLPGHLSVGYYSATLGKTPSADVIVATIGSVYRAAHILGNIKCVVIDECHLINPNGADQGRYRQFLTDMAKYCAFRVVGLTATPFRGNGVWLTDGDAPLFTGIAHTAKMQDLMNDGFLAPLVRPVDAIQTRIDTGDIKTTSGDYNIGELSGRVEDYLDQIVAESLTLAADRRKLIAFTPTIENAEHLVAKFKCEGIHAALVCGETDKREREDLIRQFRAGEIRCLVTVLALATGFDVPDVDCIIWARPTQSPVLYVQGAGRGLRIADGKTDCLWLDFSDTTERLGPIDAIKGRKKQKKVDKNAPTKICDECGERCSASAKVCPSCGFEFPAHEPEREIRGASDAPVMTSQIQRKIVTYPITDVKYSIHKKEGSPDSLRVDYWSGLKRVGSEWVCFEHTGWARAKAEAWWKKFVPYWRWCISKERPWWDEPSNFEDSHWDGLTIPKTINQAMWCLAAHQSSLHDDHEYKDEYKAITPSTITVNETGKWPEIINVNFEPITEAA